ncbi:MAG: hypothetical protein R2741_15795 [Methanolobus sp.]
MNASSGVVNISDIKSSGNSKVQKESVPDTVLADKKLEAVYNSSPVISFIWKAEGDWPVEYVSGNITQLGYSTAEFLSGKMVYGDIVHPDDLDRIHLEVKSILRKRIHLIFLLTTAF